ncbi:integrin alpha FG-GAP repeat containing protein 1 [Nematocida ausubeli]|nr:integrin alpha FG-GAP repeat containing protein 1 [Nematocida ausubeli]
MHLWKRKEELIEFADPVPIASNFLPLAYTTNIDKRRVEIVGTNQSRNRIIVISKEGDHYQIENTISTSVSVDYIASTDILKNEGREYLVFSKIEKGFRIFTVDSYGQATPIGSSDTMPFLVTHTGVNPFLFTQLDGKTHFLDILEKKTHPSTSLFGILRKNHSSGFVDISGNGVANLVLDTVKNGRRVLEVWDMDNGTYTLEGSLEISGDSGPITFGDFTGTGSVDIMYLTNNTPAINIIPNRRPPYCTNLVKNNCLNKHSIMYPADVHGYSIEDKIVYPVPGISEFSLYNANGPVFPSIMDINSNTYPDILAVARPSSHDALQPMLFLNTEGKGFENEDVFSENSSHVSNVSFYRENPGMWTVLETRVINGISSLYAYKNNSDISGYHLSISTTIKTPTLTTSAVGASHACRITETGRVIVGFHPPQTGYAALQSPVITMGLGTTNVFVSSFHSRIPSPDYQTGYIQDKIVPNSVLVVEVSPERKKLQTSLHLNTNAYWPIAIPIILTILFILVVITAHFSLKARKYRKYSTRRTRYDVTFRAL